MKRLRLLLFAMMTIKQVSSSTTTTYSFGLIRGGTDFWNPVEEAWNATCPQMTDVTCYIRKQERGVCEDVIADSFLPFFVDLIYNKTVDAIVFPPCSTDITMHAPLLDMAKERGVHVITFDNDLGIESSRAAHVGTDNSFLGRTMARLLRQLRPDGGTFSIIAPAEERHAGFVEEITKYNDDDDRTTDQATWHEVGGSNFTIAGSDNYMRQMHEYAQLNPSAMIFMKQTPMRHPNWTQFVDQHRHRNITLIGTDGSDYQLDYLNRRYVDGLVGQLPYEWGTVTLQVLYDLVRDVTLTKDFYGTNVVAYNLIPLELPALELDHNLLGNLIVVGYICLVISFLGAVACIVWTYLNRATFVVRAAQPFFLYMVAGGVILMSMTHIPLSFDDDGYPDGMSLSEAEGICMSVPWLSIVGFTITFSALFSKTWRVNRLFHAKVSHARVQVTEKDVLAPFALMLTTNIVVLICWTVLDPLTYIRQEKDGTDYWNRVIAAYGSCRSEDVKPYLIPLALVNFVLVAIACWQAFQARDIKSEFSESFYIGLTVFSLFQAFLTGMPILVIVKDMPEAFYLVLTLMLFILCMAVLLLIFLPKVLMQRRYSHMSEADQKKRLKESIRSSSQAPHGHRGSGASSASHHHQYGYYSGSGHGHHKGMHRSSSGSSSNYNSFTHGSPNASASSWNTAANNASMALGVRSALKSSITAPSFVEDEITTNTPEEVSSTTQQQQQQHEDPSSSSSSNLRPIGEATFSQEASSEATARMRTGRTLASENHELGAEMVVIASAPVPPEPSALEDDDEDDEDEILMMIEPSGEMVPVPPELLTSRKKKGGEAPDVVFNKEDAADADADAKDMSLLLEETTEPAAPPPPVVVTTTTTKEEEEEASSPHKHEPLLPSRRGTTVSVPPAGITTDADSTSIEDGTPRATVKKVVETTTTTTTPKVVSVARLDSDLSEFSS